MSLSNAAAVSQRCRAWLRPPFSVLGVIYSGVLTLLRSSPVGNSSQSFTVTPLSYCRPQEIWLPHEPVCTSCYLHPVSFQQQRPRPNAALTPPRTPWINNAAVNSSSSWLISQVVTGGAAHICWLSKVNGAGPLACFFSPSVWWLARDVRPGASITTARESHFSGRKRLDFTWPQPVALDQHAVVAQSWGNGTVHPGTVDLTRVSLHARTFIQSFTIHFSFQVKSVAPLYNYLAILYQ